MARRVAVAAHELALHLHVHVALGHVHGELASVAVLVVHQLALTGHRVASGAAHLPGHLLAVVLDVVDLAALVLLAAGLGRLLDALLGQADLLRLGGHGHAPHLHLDGLLPVRARLGVAGAGGGREEEEGKGAQGEEADGHVSVLPRGRT